MADIDFTVDFSDLKEAGLSSDQFMKKWSKMVTQIIADNKRLDRAAAESNKNQKMGLDAAETVLIQSLLDKERAEKAAADKRKKQLDIQVRQEMKAAKDTAKAWQDYYSELYDTGYQGGSAKNSALARVLKEEEIQAKETQRALDAEARTVAYLTNTYAPATAASNRFNMVQEEIRDAAARGIITLDQQAAALDRLEAEYKAFNANVYMAGSRFNDITVAGLAAGRGINKFGMYAQQAGYQIGDFAVQVQAGTNVGVAFAQQAAQLSGLIPGLGGAIAAFASIGLGILIQNLTRAKKEAEETFETLGSIESLGDIYENLGITIRDSLSSAFAEIRREYGDLVADIERRNLNNLRDNLLSTGQAALNSAMDPLRRQTYDALQDPRMRNMSYRDLTRLQDQANSFLVAQEQAVQRFLQAGLDPALKSAEEISQAYSDAYQVLIRHVPITSEIRDAILGWAKEQEINLQITEDTNDSLQDRLDLLEKQREFARQTAERHAEILAYVGQELHQLQVRNQLLFTAAQYGEDSIQYLDAVLATSVSQYRIELMKEGVQGQSLNTLVNIYRQNLLLEQLEARSLATSGQLLSINSQLLSNLRSIADYALEQIKTMEDNISLMEIANQYGRDSIQYMDEELRINLENYQIDLQKRGIQGQLLANMMALKEEEIRTQQAANRTRIAYERMVSLLRSMASVDLSASINIANSAAQRLLGTLRGVMSTLGRIGQIGLSNSALMAENAALAGGASPGMARVEGQMADFNSSNSWMPEPVRNALGMAMRSGLTNQVQLEEENSALVDAWNSANSDSSGGGGGGGSSEERENILQNIREEIAQRQRLVGIYGNQRSYLENYIEIERQLGDERQNYTEEQIAQVAALQTALEQSEQNWNSLFTTFSSNIEEALMSIVSGSENVVDAAKSMIRSILLEMYQAQVAKPAAEFLGNFLTNLFMAKGGAFIGGVQAFAAGGVVNAPTLFGHSRGIGLMGEAGPEAILPLSRGYNGELGVKMNGSSGAVTVVQNFYISANGDETVRTIVRSESKNIANAAKMAVLDARRRNQKGF